MVLSTRFFKIAKNILKRNQRPLREVEHNILMEKILDRIFFVNMFSLIILAIGVAVLFFYMLIGILASTKLI
jgi:hypothetical protein